MVYASVMIIRQITKMPLSLAVNNSNCETRVQQQRSYTCIFQLYSIYFTFTFFREKAHLFYDNMRIFATLRLNKHAHSTTSLALADSQSTPVNKSHMRILAQHLVFITL